MQSPNRELPSKDYAPQNTYRSYTPMGTYDGGGSFNYPGVSHERLSIQETISRANGGITSLDQMVDDTDQYQSDGK